MVDFARLRDSIFAAGLSVGMFIVIMPIAWTVEVPAPGAGFQDCAACPEMKVVPAGEFVQGSPPGSSGHFHSEGVIRSVSIAKPFAVGKYEVTFDEWDACVAAQRCVAVDDGDWGRGRHPVIYVNWEQATAYTDWLSGVTGKPYRLLSQSEWEYAARAGLPRFRFFGLTPEQLCRVANVYDVRSWKEYEFDWEHVDCDDGFSGLAPVGSLRPNAFGLHDMQGNVAEWTMDCRSWRTWRNANLDGSPLLAGDCRQRSYRGGSWLANGPRYLRTPDRYRYFRAHSEDLGFRVGLSLP